MCLTERGPRPVDRANTSAASPPPLLPRSRKALRASAGACNVLPAGAWSQPLSFIVIGWRFLCSPCCRSPRQSGHWGRCPVRSDFRCDPAKKQQAAPGAACWKIGDQIEPWPPPVCCVAAIPEPGSADAALEGSLDPPPTQGCANGAKQIRAVVQPAKPSGHVSSLPLASSEARCNAWFCWRKTRHRANRSRNYRAGLLPSR